eukprot:9380047-Lingulodinium_polyedra.AAC.1
MDRDAAAVRRLLGGQGEEAAGVAADRIYRFRALPDAAAVWGHLRTGAAALGGRFLTELSAATV